MLCKKCHTEMTVMQEDNVNGLICPKCGWNIVTTKIDDIMLDTQLYQLYILKNEHINRNQIRILSKISGVYDLSNCPIPDYPNCLETAQSCVHNSSF